MPRDAEDPVPPVRPASSTGPVHAVHSVHPADVALWAPAATGARSRLFPWAIVLLPFLVTLPAFMLAVSLLLSRAFFTAVRIDYNAGTLLLPGALVAGAVWGWAVSRQDVRPRRLRIAIAVNLAAAFALGALRVWATHIEPHCLQLRTVRIESAKVTRPLRILHFSDVQSDRVGDYEARVFARIAELKPDLVINTGDFLQPRRPAPEKYREGILALNALFATLHPPLGVVGVAGNVDRFLDDPALPRLEDIRLLNDETADLDWGGAHIRILGLTMQSSWGDGESLVNRWVTQGSPGDFTIVLGHAPDYVPLIAAQPIDLCLASHTHGGQVRLPFIGAVATLSHLPRGLVLGYHALGATHLNVSGGVGCEHAAGLPNIRFLCPPEMTLIEVVPTPPARAERSVGAVPAVHGAHLESVALGALLGKRPEGAQGRSPGQA